MTSHRHTMGLMIDHNICSPPVCQSARDEGWEQGGGGWEWEHVATTPRAELPPAPAPTVPAAHEPVSAPKRPQDLEDDALHVESDSLTVNHSPAAPATSGPTAMPLATDARKQSIRRIYEAMGWVAYYSERRRASPPPRVPLSCWVLVPNAAREGRLAASQQHAHTEE